jgi:hypothetical protein
MLSLLETIKSSLTFSIIPSFMFVIPCRNPHIYSTMAQVIHVSLCCQTSSTSGLAGLVLCGVEGGGGGGSSGLEIELLLRTHPRTGDIRDDDDDDDGDDDDDDDDDDKYGNENDAIGIDDEIDDDVL